jgi:hypothetical protein
MMHLGDFVAGSTVYFKFATNSAAGVRTDPSSAWEAADIRVYKNGSTTERASTAGFTVTSTFDSMTGITHVSLDLADNTDSGFYAAGSEYDVVLYPDETIDSAAVSAVLAHFSIERSVALSANVIADAILKRDWTAVTGEAARSLLNALRLLRNKWSIDPTTGVLTVYKEDDTTAAWTAQLSTSSAASPVTTSDPA